VKDEECSKQVGCKKAVISDLARAHNRTYELKIFVNGKIDYEIQT
jgi:hypothetical protein